MREGLRMAYLDTLLGLRAVPRTGALRDDGSEEGVAEALVSLRSALSRVAGPESGSQGASADAPGNGRIAQMVAPGQAGPEGRVHAWLRSLKRRVLRTWYVRSLLIGKELALAQENVSSLDREASEAYRTFAQAIYGLGDAIDGLERRVEALEEAHKPTREIGDGV
jgi:hypothetical protein